MNVTVSAKGMEVDAALREQAERRVRFGLGRFAPRLGKVRVRLEDVNGPRGGEDIRCQVDVRMVDGGRLLAEDLDADVRNAVDRAVDKASRAVARQLERERGGRAQTGTEGGGQ
jgi:putative sigma-54 modulation protein